MIEGSWQVDTESGSTYLVDLNAGCVIRVTEGVALRRDNEIIRLLALDPPQVGARMNMVLDLRGDGLPTVRSTSPVTKITELETRNENN